MTNILGHFTNLCHFYLTFNYSVVLPFVMYVRTVRVPSSNGSFNEYLRVVQAYRENGKVKQRIIADLGRRDLLAAVLPNLRRILEGTPKLQGQEDSDVDILETFGWGPLLVVRKLFEELGLWDLFDSLSGSIARSGAKESAAAAAWRRHDVAERHLARR